MELLGRGRLKLGRILDACLTELNRKQLPGRLLESLVHDLSEEQVFPAGGRDDKPIGVYIHVPFCPTKCAFCGYSVEYDRSESVRTEYARALRTHLVRLARRLSRHQVSWVSFGGGTPSTLEPFELEMVLDGIADFRHTPDMSISMEMRVDTLERFEKFEAYRALGISRFCFGVQSFDDRVRRSFGLRLSGDEAYALLDRMRRTGVEYAFDVIWGGPEQTQRDLDLTLDRVFSLEPHQIDAYPLFPIRGTTLFKSFKTIAADDLIAHQRRLSDHLLRRMTDAGYRRIDGVMFSRTKDIMEDPRGGFREASSLLVPETGHIVGVGQSAHSLYGGTFATNPYTARKYIELMSSGEELVYTGLRAPMPIAAFRHIVGLLTRERDAKARLEKFGPGLDDDTIEREFYKIRFWWHVFTGLRGWNAMSNKVGYPIGNENTVRHDADSRYIAAEERRPQRLRPELRARPSLPVVA
jgi:oxygen-independent coproporphyrinogen-3 oxidase